MFIKKYFLQLAYASKAFFYLPITFFKRVVFGKDPYWKQFFWNKWGEIPQELLCLAKNRPTIWIDALGGGEVTQIVTFCKLLRQAYPDHNIILSTNNFFPFHFVKKTIKEIDYVFDVPWDIRCPARKALKAIHPELFIVVDQVRFPIILREAKKLNIKTVLISAALVYEYTKSEGMARAVAYEFYEYFDFIGVTEERDKQSYIKLGASSEKVKVTGNMKFDLDYIKVSRREKESLRDDLMLTPDDFIIVAGSVHQKEEKIILSGYKEARKEIPNLKLVLAPRYMNSIPAMEETFRGLGLKYVRRSRIKDISSLCDNVILLDTFGELSKLYSISSAMFIGNSIYPRDRFALGQNIVEPLIHLRPVFFGPYMNKWRLITEELKSVWSGLEITDENNFAEALICLWKDKDLVKKIEDKCREIINRNRGGTMNNFNLVKSIMEAA